MRLLNKVETYNRDTEQTCVMLEDTVGTYKTSGGPAGSIQARKFGDEDAVLGGAVSTTHYTSCNPPLFRHVAGSFFT